MSKKYVLNAGNCTPCSRLLSICAEVNFFKDSHPPSTAGTRFHHAHLVQGDNNWGESVDYACNHKPEIVSCRN